MVFLPFEGTSLKAFNQDDLCRHLPKRRLRLGGTGSESLPPQAATEQHTFVLPVTVLAGRGRAGSSATAGSWRCSPGSEGPARKAGRPHPGWPGCWAGSTGRPPGSQTGSSVAPHGQLCLSGSHVLQGQPSLNTASPQRPTPVEPNVSVF